MSMVKREIILLEFLLVWIQEPTSFDFIAFLAPTCFLRFAYVRCKKWESSEFK